MIYPLTFLKSEDKDVVQFSRGSDGLWRALMSDAALEASGLYILTARNSQGEEKYPVILTVLPNIDLTHVTDCELEDG